MKNGFLKRLRMAVAPLALVGAMAAFSPVAALAAVHGGGGHGGGFGGHGGFSGGHAYSAPARGRAYGGGHVGGYVGRGYAGRGYYGGPGFGFGVGVYAPYGYAAPVCNPAGFYDQYGNWEYYPGCAVPYGY